MSSGRAGGGGGANSREQRMSSIHQFVAFIFGSGAHASNRVCNALALLQCVASHTDTRQMFLHAHIPLFLYPFLNTVSKTRPFEYLRLTSLGVIGALVKADDQEVPWQDPLVFVGARVARGGIARTPTNR